jgi:hypothetical protein
VGTVSPGAILRLVVLTIWVSLSAGFVEAQPAADTTLVGPQVGNPVPPFSGTDQFGRTQTLNTTVGPNGAMLVFFRSADW